MAPIKQNFWNRGGVFGWFGSGDDARPAGKKHPIFGQDPFYIAKRVQIYQGEIYSAHYGAVPMTKAQLLADPWVIEGTWSAPPPEVVAMLAYETWTVTLGLASPYGSPGGEYEVFRGYTSGTDYSGDDYPPPTIYPDYCRVYAPGSGNSTPPVHSSAFPSRYQAEHLSRVPNPRIKGGSIIPSLGPGGFGGGAVVHSSTPGTTSSVTLDTPLSIGDPPSPYQMTFNKIVNSESAEISVEMSYAAAYFPRHQLWVLPVTVTASAHQWSSMSANHDDLYNSLISEHGDVISTFEAEQIDAFADTHPADHLTYRPAGFGAYRPFPLTPVDHADDLFSAATITHPTFFHRFQSWET